MIDDSATSELSSILISELFLLAEAIISDLKYIQNEVQIDIQHIIEFSLNFLRFLWTKISPGIDANFSIPQLHWYSPVKVVFLNSLF